MIGGTGPESTVEYYRRLISTYHARVSESGAPPIIINSVDNKNLVKWFTAGELAPCYRFSRGRDRTIGARGRRFRADRGGYTAPWLRQARSSERSIPLLSIVEATADAATKAGLRRLALFGTRFTMEAALFPEAFARRGMTIVVPNEKEQEFIHEKYMGELFVGAILDETRAALVDIVETMKQRDNVDGLILGGTELSLILREPTAAGLPVLDTTQIHVETALEWMLRE